MSTSVLPTPKPAAPVEGQPGHFAHSNWCKAAVEALDTALDAGTFGVPVGTIVAFSGSAALPANWKVCDGTNGTPNLTGRFILGASGAHPAGQASDMAETVTLTVDNLPSHNHGGATGDAGSHAHVAVRQVGSGSEASNNNGDARNAEGDPFTYTGSVGNHAHTIPAQGGGAAFSKMPPFYALVYIMRVA